MAVCVVVQFKKEFYKVSTRQAKIRGCSGATSDGMSGGPMTLLYLLAVQTLELLTIVSANLIYCSSDFLNTDQASAAFNE